MTLSLIISESQDFCTKHSGNAFSLLLMPGASTVKTKVPQRGARMALDLSSHTQWDP